MKAKRKAASFKPTWQANRRCYTWHLRPPFDKKFDCSHWWKGLPDSKIEPVAALYELARRHPIISKIPAAAFLKHASLSTAAAELRRSPFPSFFEPIPSLRLTRLLGMYSWPELTKTEQRDWKSSIGKMKGFDLRQMKSLCFNVTALARSAVYRTRENDRKRFGAEYIEELTGIRDYSVYAKPTDQEWETAIAQQAIAAHRQGHVLLSVVPDLAANKVASLTAKIYHDHQQNSSPTKQKHRARSQDWLDIISRFEDAENSKHKAKSQLFARYRRIVDAISFT